MIELLRTLRLRDLFLLFIGSVIGSGIFRTPGPILRQVGGSVGVAMLVWIVGGVLSLLGALTYAELAACNPQAGDRKSTRLNSSHGYISYAVFCLKKKKIIQIGKLDAANICITQEYVVLQLRDALCRIL